jgi:hypothetical protein
MKHRAGKSGGAGDRQLGKEASVMRRLHWLVAISFGTGTAIVAACGGSSSNNNDNGNNDSGTADVVVSADTSPASDAADAADTNVPACVPDASLNDLNPADAALGDAGGSVGLCLSCTKQNCASQVTECNADCSCVSDLSDLYSCIASGKSILTCGQSLVGGGADQAETDIGTCVFQSCAKECNINFGPQPGKDGGGASDGGGDSSAADGSADAAGE